LSGGPVYLFYNLFHKTSINHLSIWFYLTLSILEFILNTMGRRLNIAAMTAAVRAYLGGIESATAKEVAGQLRVSQPVVSRLMAQLSDEVLVVGKARATRYAMRRLVSGVGRSVPIYEVGPHAETQKLATLHSLARGFYVETQAHGTGFYPGLPYFLYDLKPAGFLGRLLPARHPELEAPSDIRMWSDDDCLRYFTRYGWDLSGNLLVGDAAFAAHLQHLRDAPKGLDAASRARAFVRSAENVLESGMAGSSAVGEQPKFLSTVAGRQVLVKFSPQVADPVGERVADLLWCEHLMHGVLAARGIPSANSEVVQAGGRIFLQVERFDREGAGGRHGLLSLTALDLHGPAPRGAARKSALGGAGGSSYRQQRYARRQHRVFFA
jgi:hypothetical protein